MMAAISEITGADVHDERLVGLPQHFGPGERADEGGACRARDRLRGRRRRGADCPGNGEYLVGLPRFRTLGAHSQTLSYWVAHDERSSGTDEVLGSVGVC